MAVQAVPATRARDADRTRAEILAVATHEFSERGYSGARVDEIAARTRTTKRMIYYYYGSKEELYVAVLERAYSQIRDAEQALDVDHLDPVSAIRKLAELTFDHHEAHPDFVRLVSIENIHHARHIKKSRVLASINTRVVQLIERILVSGRAQKAFVRSDVDALDVHMLISAYCVFRHANQYTFGAIFGRNLTDRRRRAHYRKLLGDAVVAYLTSA